MQKALSKIDVHKNIHGKPNDVWEPHCVLVYIHRTATENYLQCSFPFVYFLPSNDVREIFVFTRIFSLYKMRGTVISPWVHVMFSVHIHISLICPSKWSSFPWIRPLFLECVNCVYVCSNLVHHMKESVQYIILIQSYLKHSESSSQLRKESIYEPLSRKNGRVRDRTKEGDSASKHQGHPLLMSEGAWVLGWMTTSWNRAPQKGDINYNRKSS